MLLFKSQRALFEIVLNSIMYNFIQCSNNYEKYTKLNLLVMPTEEDLKAIVVHKKYSERRKEKKDRYSRVLIYRVLIYREPRYTVRRASFLSLETNIN